MDMFPFLPDGHIKASRENYLDDYHLAKVFKKFGTSLYTQIPALSIFIRNEFDLLFAPVARNAELIFPPFNWFDSKTI